VAFEREALTKEPFGVRLAAGDVRRGDEPERDHRCARPEPALAGDAIEELEAQAVGWVDPLERLDAEVLTVWCPSVRDDDLVPEIERERGAIEPGAKVGGRRRSADADPHDAAFSK
jgi:hypothetical protein